MNKFIGIILVCLIYQNELKAQSNFGLGISGQTNKIVNISKDTLSPYGFSGARFKQNIDLSLVPHIHYRRIINDRFSIQTGLSYQRIRKDLRFDFELSGIFNGNVNDTLKIRLNYLTVPIRVNYRLTKSNKKNGLYAGLGVNTSLLLKGKDNYQEIIPWEILLPRKPFQNLSLAPSVFIFYDFEINNKHNVNFEMAINRQIISYLASTWGFRANLKPSRIQSYSLGIHYYF